MPLLRRAKGITIRHEVENERKSSPIAEFLPGDPDRYWYIHQYVIYYGGRTVDHSFIARRFLIYAY